MWRAMPAADIHEHDDSYSMSIELPDLTAANIQVTLSNGHLVISGEKKEEIKEEKKNIHLSERRYGSFERTFRLPSGVDRDKIAAVGR